MEFIRFGSTIPGSYWGCCACDVIQDFNQYPSEKASIQLVSGDGGGPLTRGNSFLFAGPTYEDIFWQRIRFGTFDTRDMPNHAFLAILTAEQIGEWNYDDAILTDDDYPEEDPDTPGPGLAWLKILKKAGFEFIRTVGNSVYDGNEVSSKKPTGTENKNYIFGLFRNIGTNAVVDPFTPPKAWTDLPSVMEEALESLSQSDRASIHTQQRIAHRKIWDEIGPPKLLTETEVVKAGAPVILAGLRSKYQQEEKSKRERKKAKEDEAAGKAVKEPMACPAPTNPFT